MSLRLARLSGSVGFLFGALLIGAAWSGGSAAADDKPQPAGPADLAARRAKQPPTKQVLQQYGAALSQGREADSKGQLAEARKHFEAAVALLPEGGAAQSELGWVAYRQKDLAAAERATLAAIACSNKPSLRAASLYNLGKILADQGKKAEAIKALREAWELGRNPASLSELKALDPGAAAAAWPGLQALDGPIQLKGTTPAELLLAACRAQVFAAVSSQDPAERMLTREEIYELDAEKLSCQEQSATAKGPGTAAAVRVMAVSSHVSLNHYGLSTIGVWVDSREGWLYKVIRTATEWKWQGETDALKSARTIGNYVEIRELVESRDESESAAYWKGGKEQGQPAPETVYTSDGYAYYLGIGASGRPGLTSPIHFLTARKVIHNHDSERSAEKSYPLTVSAGGELQIGAPSLTRKKMSEKEFTGREIQTPSGSFPLKFQ